MIKVLEKEIEDILCFHSDILANILNIEYESMNIIARQRTVKTGKLDILIAYKDYLILIELKITYFKNEYLKQIKNYLTDLEQLKQINQIPNIPIKPIILVTNYNDSDRKRCERENVELIKYNVEDILSQFYFRFAEYSQFITMRPVDCGVWNIHLLNKPLTLLSKGFGLDEIAKELKIKRPTVNHYFTLSRHLNLTTIYGREHILTELGSKYIDAIKDVEIINIMNDEQIKIITDFIIENPFYSPVVFGIYQVVESVFFLSKTHCPVNKNELERFFKSLVGGENLWSERSTFLMTGAYSNFAVELGLLGKIKNKYYLTPSGFKFILFLQLHRSIKLIKTTFRK